MKYKNFRKMLLMAGVVLVLFFNIVLAGIYTLASKIAKDKQELKNENQAQNAYYEKRIDELQNKQNSSLRDLEKSVQEATTSYKLRKEQQRIYLASLTHRTYAIHNVIPASVNIPYSTVVDTVRAAVIAKWGEAAWPAAQAIINSESGFNPTAQNPTSTAYGIFQFLDTTWNGYGCQKTSDVQEQTKCGINYIAQRYGTPDNAWNYHVRVGSY